MPLPVLPTLVVHDSSAIRGYSKDFSTFAEVNEFGEGEDLRAAAGAFADGVEEVVGFEGAKEVGDHGGTGHVLEFRDVAGAENGPFEHKIEKGNGELGVGKIDDLLL